MTTSRVVGIRAIDDAALPAGRARAVRRECGLALAHEPGRRDRDIDIDGS